jgi:predicted phosphodiesterase
MTQIALITDTHWGARADSPIFAQHISRFYEEVFFPYLDQHNINFIFHLGDIVDRRKYINFVTAKNLTKDFIAPIRNKNKFLYALIGNHDTFYKNTNEVNSMDVLYGDRAGFTYISEPIEIDLECKILMMPWICADNYDKCMKMIQETDAQVLFGHLELKGFEMYKGQPNDHGFDSSMFDKFDVVCSGHFHHKSSRGNIHYLGAPYEMTWSDYDDPRGFHVFDTKTRQLTFIQNPNKIFHKIHYNDNGMQLEDILINDFEQYKNCVIKVIVKNKTNPHMFDVFIDKLEKAGVADLQVVEDHLNLNLEVDEDILKDAEDTLTLLTKYASQVSKQKSKELSKFLQDLYSEALTVE